MLQGLATLALLLFLKGETLSLLVKPAGVISLPRNAFSTVQFKYPSCHIVKEVTVVGYGYYRALVLLQMGFEPLDTLGVEMVGRLVEKQYVRLAQKKAAESHTPAFASGKSAYLSL